MATENVTTKFKVDISDLKSNINAANRQIQLLTAEMRNANAGMERGAETADSLSTKIQKQGQIVEQEQRKLAALREQLQRLNENQQQGEQIVADLTAQYNNAVETYGEASAEARQYAAQLSQAQTAQNRNREAIERLNVQIVNQDTAVQNARAQVTRYQIALDAMQSETQQTTSATETLTDRVSRQESELRDLRQRYIDVAAEQGDTSAEAQQLAQQINDLSGELRDNRTRLNDAEQAADQFDQSLSDVGDSADDTTSGGLNTFGVALGNLASNLISNIISKMKDMVTQTIEVGKTFQASMSNVAALSGATDEELQMLTDTAKKWGSQSKYSASEAADALGFMALAGWDANQSADALGGVLNLAAASNMELAEASDMVTDYMSAFGMQADESAYFADILAYAQANANTTAQGLGEAFKNSAANMNAAGQDIETTVSFLAMLANQGLKGSEAGTALTAVMRDMTAKMKDGKIAIGETSVEVMDAQGNYRDLTDIMKDVEAATQGMGDAEKATALQSTFTADSIKGLNLILNAGVDEAAAFESELRNSGGAAEEMAKIMGDNLSGDLTALGSQFEGVQIALYEKFEPALRKGVAAVSKLIDVFKWIMKNGKPIAAAITGVATAVGTFMLIIKRQAIMAAFTTGLTAIKTAFMGLWTVLSANPIGLIVAAISGLVAAFIMLWNKSDEFRNFWIDLWENVKEVSAPIFEAIKQFFVDLWEKAQPVIEFLREKITAAIAEVQEMFAAAWGAITAIWDFAQPYFAAIWEAIQIVFSVVSTWFKDVFNSAYKNIKKVWDAVQPYFKKIWNGIKLIFSAAKTVISGFFTAAWNSIKVVWDLAVGYFKIIWENIKLIFSVVEKVFRGDFQGAWNAIKQIWDNVVSYFQSVWDGIKTVFANVIEFFKTAFGGGVTAIQGVWSVVAGFFGGIWTSIKTTFSSVGTWFKEKFQTAWKNIKSVFDLETVKKFFGDLWDGIKDKFTSIGTSVGEAVGGAFKTAINWAIDKVEETLNFLPENINGALQKITDLTGIEVPLFPTVDLPRLAKGGIVNRSMLANIGEDGAEAVIPLERNKAGLRQIANLLADEMGGATLGGATKVGDTIYNFNQTNNSPKALSRWDIYRQTRNLINATKGV